MCLSDLRDRVLTIPALNSRYESLQSEIKMASADVADLLLRYESELRDVTRIKEDSFSTFLYRLVGQYQSKLEKEQSEEIRAKIAYDRAVARLNCLTRDKEELLTRLDSLRADKRAYEAELENRRREIRDRLSEPSGQDYWRLMEERDAIVSQITEIDEARKALYKARSTAAKIANSLSKAEGWAAYDAFTRGGVISHMFKYSHIDAAEENYHTLSHELRELQSELGDVHGFSGSGLHEISSGQRMVDFWFDNIFTDLSVRRNIIENAAQTDYLISSLNTAETALSGRMRDMECALVENKRKEEELLMAV